MEMLATMCKALGSNSNGRSEKQKEIKQKQNQKPKTIETFVNYMSHKEFVSPYMG